jgi:hypothetical protein
MRLLEYKNDGELSLT